MKIKGLMAAVFIGILVTACGSNQTETQKEANVTNNIEATDENETTIDTTEVEETTIEETTAKPSKKEIKKKNNQLNKKKNPSSDKYKAMEVPKSFKSIFDNPNEQLIIYEVEKKSLNDYLKISYDVNVSTLYRAGTVDMDGDGIEEMLIQVYDGTELKEPVILILHYENGEVYGYEPVNFRGMLSLKIDGRLMSSGGAFINEIQKYKFDESKLMIKVLASQEGYTYKKKNKACSENEYNKYLGDFNGQKEVEFKDINIVVK